MPFKKGGVMGEKDIVMMSGKELGRASVIGQAISRLITQKKAAEAIGLSYRQTKRLVARVREEGEKGIIHRLRGKPGNRKIAERTRARVIRLCREKYWDFGPTFASEKLQEREGLRVNRETLRLWLGGEGKWAWQRKGRKHRKWRERKEYFGEMVQMDGSHHDWLEGRGPGLVFMGYIDDATGTAFGRFYDAEGSIPAMDSFMRYTKKYGLPQSVYLDRHTIYKSPKEQTIEEQLRNEKPLSQFERAMKELGVRVIHALSPQAKGRIERAFRTLQDRLIKEMRLAGIKTQEGANQFLEGYLPEHNRRFSVPAVKGGDLHRKAPGKEELRKILCLRAERTLRNDATIRYRNKFYQLQDVPRRRVKTVLVEEWLDGSLHIKNDGVYLRYREIAPNLLRKPETAPRAARRLGKRYIPPRDHPWRRFRIKTYGPASNANKAVAGEQKTQNP